MNAAAMVRTAELPVIGGVFGLVADATPTPDALPPILRAPVLELATARSALALLVQTLRPGSVWLPAYLCSALLEAVGDRARFFPVGERLHVGDDAWIGQVSPGDLVVFIDYFGFRTWDRHAAAAAARGALVVEDASHALANAGFSAQADYVIASPRKFVGVPDGGLLQPQRGRPLPRVMLPALTGGWWRDALQATTARAEFDRHGGMRTWFDDFQRAETGMSAVPAQMSELSARLLREGVDWVRLAQSRRRNFLFLADALRPLALETALPADVVPLGFPIRVARRDDVRRALFTENIFPPVHWPVPSAVPASFSSGSRLADCIMTIPCDQRYSLRDLERVVACLRRVDATPVT